MDKKQFFDRVYDVLMACCRARDDAYERFSFVHSYAEPTERPPTEFRFQGGLGFGGKFRYPRMTVDCYPEDVTPQRKEMMQQANAMLERLRLEFEQAQGKEVA